ncbi:MAG: hypothetical protein M1824_001406 [Vezdaea acicularis]|nr:MAG: hypothetical protein M1824_001406 [Vezdaea acicularis]
MAGIKRPYKEEEISSPYMPMFETFRDELDQHHDRRDRIGKASKDITAQSKKIIFTLQRVPTICTPFPPKILQETTERLHAISALFHSITPDVAGLNAWRYQRQLSGGIQEYIEAATFSHYLSTQTLPYPTAATLRLPEGVLLTESDFLLGLFDTVGELMRYAITMLARTGRLPTGLPSKESVGARDMLADIRDLRACFEGVDTAGDSGGLGRDVEKKMGVMKTCVEKVEMAVYEMIVRGRERPKGWVPDSREEVGVGQGLGQGVEIY